MSTPDIFGAGSHLHDSLLLVHCEWLLQLINEKKVPDGDYPKHPHYSDHEIKAFLLDSKIPPSAQGTINYWRLVSTETHVMDSKSAFPSFLLDAYVPEESCLSEDGCFSEVLEYVEKNNFLGLWRESCEKYNESYKLKKDGGT